MKKRIEWIDICKGLAIILVIIGHSSLETGMAFNLKSIIYSFHMPLFFILSGYLFYNIKDKNKKMSDFITEKIKSLVIPYITFNIIILLFDLLKSFITNNQINLLYRLIGIIFPIRNNEYVGKTWFLIWIFLTELIYQFISTNIKDKKFISILCIISFYTGFILIKKNIALPYHMDAVFVSLLFYHFGHILKEKNIEINNKYSILFLIVIFFITTIANMCIIDKLYDTKTTIDLYEMTLSFPIIYIINSICGSLLMMLISKHLNFSYIKKILEKVGYNSLCIYGFHTIIIQTCIKITNNIFKLQGSALYELIRSCVIVIMCLLLILPVCKICERFFPLLFGYKKGGQNEK